jgi:hypothetical protein
VTETRRTPDTGPRPADDADAWRLRMLWALVVVFTVALCASLLGWILL